MTVAPDQHTPHSHNPVGALRMQISQALEQHDATRSPIDENCLNVIKRFLSLTGWPHGPRRIFEAMPHADNVDSISAFRAVLFRLGYNTTAERANVSNLRSEYLPCFILNDLTGLMLVESIDQEGWFTVYDPKVDETQRVRRDAIDGLVVFPETIEPDKAGSEATAKPWSISALVAFAPVIRQLFLISFFVNLFALAPPLFVKMVYDSAVAAKAYDVLLGLTIGIALLLAADFLLRQVRVRLQAYLGARLDTQINETAFRHLMHLPLAQTEGAPIGAQLTRLRQMTSLSELFTSPLATALFDLPFLVLFIAVIAAIGGHLVWVPVALIAAYVVAGLWAFPRITALVKESGNLRSQLTNLTTETISEQRAIRDLGMEHVWLHRHRKLSAQSAAANIKVRQANFLVQTLSQALLSLAGAAILGIGAGLVIAGELTAGSLIAVMALVWRVLGPIRNLFLSSLTVGQTVQSIQQIDRLVRIPLETKPNGNTAVRRRFKGRVSFDKVVFRYPGAREPALRGVSFDVEPGEVLCLYGKSGAGTSTTLRVLMGLYQQQAGAVLIDGLDLWQLDKSEWRRSLGVAMHSNHLFHGTVAQNIRLARPDASDAEIDAIIRRFGIDQYFGGALDHGVETSCAVMARSKWPDALTSRIILARAFIKDAPVFVLEDPAASLDFDGEKALLSMIEERRGASTIIMTTQRPSHMRLADKVLWLENGAPRDIGAPDEIVPKILAA